MAFEHKENTATVFENDKKSSDNQPDFTGKGKVDGAMKEFALWKRETKGGKTMLFVKWSEPQEKFQSKKGQQAGF